MSTHWQNLPRTLAGRPVEVQENFLLRVTQECRRAERSRQRFVLLLVKGFANLEAKAPTVLAQIAAVTREIDVMGWYEEDDILGVIFAELGDAQAAQARCTILQRIATALSEVVYGDEVALAAHIFPQDLNGLDRDLPNGPRYSAVPPIASGKKIQHIMKRVIDVVGSALLLLVLSPLFAAAALAVRLSSAGPILYRQARLGRHGKPFVFLKFRSMKASNDPSIHENYVKSFIRGTAERNMNDKGEPIFKLTQDPRVTRLGRFLRKSSVDELPQLWNVLVGDMSLVGPRPPIPYEVECYELWHQRRILELKPGITGLWQISGRSRIGFNEMVRLDLRYAREWSPWLDIKILLLTPRAIFGDGGAS